MTDLAVHFAPYCPRILFTGQTLCLLLKLREVQSGKSRNPLSPADRSEGRGGGPMAGLGMSQLLPTAAAALLYLVVFVKSHNKLTADNTLTVEQNTQFI